MRSANFSISEWPALPFHQMLIPHSFSCQQSSSMKLNSSWITEILYIHQMYWHYENIFMQPHHRTSASFPVMEATLHHNASSLESSNMLIRWVMQCPMTFYQSSSGYLMASATRNHLVSTKRLCRYRSNLRVVVASQPSILLNSVLIQPPPPGLMQRHLSTEMWHCGTLSFII